MKDLKISKATGIDSIPARFLKDGAEVIAKPLAQIINLSIATRKFPKDCKTEKVKLLYKKGSTTEPQNYRPISFLPVISKIFEKIIHKQTQTFLNTNKLLFEYQTGFRENYSTDTCLSHLNTFISSFDKGKNTGLSIY